jgi:hypothetical protein
MSSSGRFYIPPSFGGCSSCGGCRSCGGAKLFPKTSSKNIGKIPNLGTKKRSLQIFPGCVCQNTYDGTRIPGCYCRSVEKSPSRKVAANTKNPWISFLKDYAEDQKSLYAAAGADTPGKRYFLALKDPEAKRLYAAYKHLYSLT